MWLCSMRGDKEGPSLPLSTRLVTSDGVVLCMSLVFGIVRIEKYVAGPPKSLGVVAMSGSSFD